MLFRLLGYQGPVVSQSIYQNMDVATHHLLFSSLFYIPTYPPRGKKKICDGAQFGDSLLQSTLYLGFNRRISHVQIILSVGTPLRR